MADKKLHDIIRAADIISPWTVGRYVSPISVVRHAEQRWKPDIEWCAQHGKEYLPVVFPGFSWHNMKRVAPVPTGRAPVRHSIGRWEPALLKTTLPKKATENAKRRKSRQATAPIGKLLVTFRGCRGYFSLRFQ